MNILAGKVINGRIEIEVGELPEGAEVTVYVRREEDEYIPTPEEEAELEAAMDEADLGGGMPYEEFRRELIDLERKLTRR